MRRALSWFGVALVFGLTLEITARVDDWITYGAPLLGDYSMEELFKSGARGYRGVPNARYMNWRLDSQGFRGPDLQPDRGQIRVVAYGASETFGVYEDDGREYPRELERELNERSAPGRFEVVNAGMPGMRVGSGIAFLYDIGAAIHPRVVVIYPTPTHYIGVSRPYCGAPVRMPARGGFSLPELRIIAKAKDRLKEALPRTALTVMRQVGIELSVRGERVIEHVEEGSLRAFDTDLECAVKAVRDIGAIPILATHTSRFGLVHRPDDDYWLTGWRLQYPEMKQGGFIDLEARANAQIRAVARHDDVKLVDVDAAMSGHTEYFADHAHFTNAGAQRIAALLTDAVLDVLPDAVHPAAGGS